MSGQPPVDPSQPRAAPPLMAPAAVTASTPSAPPPPEATAAKAVVIKDDGKVVVDGVSSRDEEQGGGGGRRSPRRPGRREGEGGVGGGSIDGVVLVDDEEGEGVDDDGGVMANPLLQALSNNNRASSSSLMGQRARAGSSLLMGGSGQGQPGQGHQGAADLVKKRQSIKELESLFRKRKDEEEAGRDVMASEGVSSPFPDQKQQKDLEGGGGGDGRHSSNNNNNVLVFGSDEEAGGGVTATSTTAGGGGGITGSGTSTSGPRDEELGMSGSSGPLLLNSDLRSTAQLRQTSSKATTTATTSSNNNIIVTDDAHVGHADTGSSSNNKLGEAGGMVMMTTGAGASCSSPSAATSSAPRPRGWNDPTPLGEYDDEELQSALAAGTRSRGGVTTRLNTVPSSSSHSSGSIMSHHHSSMYNDHGGSSSSIASGGTVSSTPESVRLLRLFNLRYSTLKRLWQVLGAYPFVLVLSHMNYARLKYPRTTLGLLNLLVYIVPAAAVYSLRGNSSQFAAVLAFLVYLTLCLIPVIAAIMSKVRRYKDPSQVVDGTFCFRPEARCRLNMSNVLICSGLFLEFMQAALYCAPYNVFCLGDCQVATSHQFWLYSYIPFEVFFFLLAVVSLLPSCIIIANAVVRGKAKARLFNNLPVWMGVTIISGPLNVTITTIMLQALVCDYNSPTGQATLLQDPNMVCWEGKHLHMAVLALLCLGIYTMQVTILPAGTYKECMRNPNVDILFVPAYVEMLLLLKTVFSALSAFFWNHIILKVSLLTLINLGLLYVVFVMAPCPIREINIFKNAAFFAATFTGLSTICFVGTGVLPDHDDVLPPASGRHLYLAIVCCVWVLSAASAYVYARLTRQDVELRLYFTMGEHDYNLARQRPVGPRSLELLIGLSASCKTNKGDQELVKGCIPQVVQLMTETSYRRLQFQAAWIIQQAARNRGLREELHKHGVEDALIEALSTLDINSQVTIIMEILAALANVAACPGSARVLAFDFHAVPLLITIANDTNPKASEFALMALCNVAAHEEFRPLIEASGGMTAILAALLSEDVGRRRAAIGALANLALSPTYPSFSLAADPRIVSRLTRVTITRQIPGNREPAAALHNLSCHPSLHRVLIERQGPLALQVCLQSPSIDPQALTWAHRALGLLADAYPDSVTPPLPLTQLQQQLHRHGGGLGMSISPSLAATYARHEGEGEEEDGNGGHVSSFTLSEALGAMHPLTAVVEWSTWGSRLDTYFNMVFTRPKPAQIRVTVKAGEVTRFPLGAKLYHGWKGIGRQIRGYELALPPLHGKVRSFHPRNDTVEYVSEAGFLEGHDSFTVYRLNGWRSEAPIEPVVVKIHIVPPPHILYRMQQQQRLLLQQQQQQQQQQHHQLGVTGGGGLDASVTTTKQQRTEALTASLTLASPTIITNHNAAATTPAEPPPPPPPPPPRRSSIR